MVVGHGAAQAGAQGFVAFVFDDAVLVELGYEVAAVVVRPNGVRDSLGDGVETGKPGDGTGQGKPRETSAISLV